MTLFAVVPCLRRAGWRRCLIPVYGVAATTVALFEFFKPYRMIEPSTDAIIGMAVACMISLAIWYTRAGDLHSVNLPQKTICDNHRIHAVGRYAFETSLRNLPEKELLECGIDPAYEDLFLHFFAHSLLTQ